MNPRGSEIKVAGFESQPEGQLLTQFVDFGHAWGAAYERCVGYTKDFHTHDRVNLAFPRSSSIIQFKTKPPPAAFLVDETKFLWMPENVIHRQETISTIYDNLAVFPDKGAVAKAFADFEEKYGKKIAPPSETCLKKRTPLLEALVQEYFWERVVDRRKPELMEGLANQVLEEILRILFCPRREGALKVNTTTGELSTERAIRYIESNLFSKFDSKAIAKVAKVSVPTLFRKFQTDLGMTPRDYVFRRRMDEARSLLKGDYKVGDVAFLVGYEDITAFSKAFKSHFQVSPSQFAKG